MKETTPMSPLTKGQRYCYRDTMMGKLRYVTGIFVGWIASRDGHHAAYAIVKTPSSIWLIPAGLLTPSTRAALPPLLTSASALASDQAQDSLSQSGKEQDSIPTLTRYSYRDIVTGKHRFTRGRFIGWTQPTGPLHVPYAQFQRKAGVLLVPISLLAPETRATFPAPEQSSHHHAQEQE